MHTRSGYLFQRGKKWYLQIRVNGKTIIKSTGKTNRKDAEERRKELLAPIAIGDDVEMLRSLAGQIEGRKAELTDLRENEHPPLKIEDAWRVYIDSSTRPDTGPATLEVYRQQVAVFARWMNATHPTLTSLRDVDETVAGEFARYLTQEGKGAGTFNKYLRLLELVFRVLKTPARLTANPWSDIPRKRDIQHGRRELTVDELRKVCGAASGELRVLFAIGLYTGLRMGDAATLRWSDVDLVRALIHRIPNKTARRNPKPVLIPIHATLAGMLHECRKDDKAEFVLPETAARYQIRPDLIAREVKRHLKSCSIETHAPGTGGDTGRRASVEVGFHSLRHSFVSLCRAANAPLSVVESVVGHSSPAMTRHYTHTGELEAARAVGALPALIGDVKPARNRSERSPLPDWALALVTGMTAKNWEAVRAKLLKQSPEQAKAD
jgi:integrase